MGCMYRPLEPLSAAAILLATLLPILGATSLVAPASAAAQVAEVDEEHLPALFAEAGYETPETLKALVGIVDLPADGPPRAQWFDWRGTSTDRDDWWPASSIKLYAAVAALERSRELGFQPAAMLTYHYESEDENEYRGRLSQIVSHAIVASNNLAFDRLVEFVGMDYLNRRFFTAANGLEHTAFLRAYGGRNRNPDNGHAVNRHSPPITVQRGRRVRELPARDGRGRYECPDQGNCTTLRDLAGSIYRVMLHEHLPEEGRYDLGERELALLRSTLEAPRRAHGELLVAALRRGFGDEVPIRIYHKPGYAYRWSSDVIFVHRTDTDERFIIALAAHPGRRVIDEALTRIGAFLAARRLTSPGSD